MVSPEHALSFVKSKSTAGGSVTVIVTSWSFISVILPPSELSTTPINEYV